LAAAAASPGPFAAAAIAQPAHAVAPWQMLNGSYDSAVKSGFVFDLPLPGQSTGRSVLFMGADNGGASRSLDLGKSWSNVNGGRGFSTSSCGGYSEEQVPGCMAGKENAFPYGGPPTAMQWYHKTKSVEFMAAGGLPASIAPNLAELGQDAIGGARGALVYRSSSRLFVSIDAGRQWAPLAPSCSVGDSIYFGPVAVDGGRPGHMVVIEVGGGNGNAYDAAGCERPAPATPPDPNNPDIVNTKFCSNRAVAWTRDVGPQVQASLLASHSFAASQSAAMQVDQAGYGAGDEAKGWRYASFTHLAAPRLQKVAGTWTATTCTVGVGQKGPANTTMSVPDWSACPNLGDKYCHGIKSPSVTSVALTHRACMNLEHPKCKCDDAPGSGPCAYPQVHDLAVDPRNGWVYASSNVGLLTSPDGGGQWQRKGGTASYQRYDPGNLAGVAKTDGDLDPAVALKVGLPPGTGARLLTFQGLATNLGITTDDAHALDLNAHPEYLVDLGKVSFAATPCEGITATDPDGAVRPYVKVRAAVSALWHNPVDPAQVLSSVFTAETECPVPGPLTTFPAPQDALVFRDTSSRFVMSGGTLGSNASWVNDAFQAVPEPMGGQVPDWQRPTKLPRSQERYGFVAANTIACRVRYTQAAVASSDDRFVYAWAYAEAVTAPYDDVLSVTPTDKNCGFYSGLWRSQDGGRSWHLATSIQDPQADYNFARYLAGVDLTVAPKNPYIVMVAGRHRGIIMSGPGTAFLLKPASAMYGEGAWAEPDCDMP
jgi:hypothetical protein